MAVWRVVKYFFLGCFFWASFSISAFEGGFRKRLYWQGRGFASFGDEDASASAEGRKVVTIRFTGERDSVTALIESLVNQLAEAYESRAGKVAALEKKLKALKGYEISTSLVPEGEEKSYALVVDLKRKRFLLKTSIGTMGTKGKGRWTHPFSLTYYSPFGLHDTLVISTDKTYLHYWNRHREYLYKLPLGLNGPELSMKLETGGLTPKFYDPGDRRTISYSVFEIYLRDFVYKRKGSQFKVKLGGRSYDADLWYVENKQRDIHHRLNQVVLGIEGQFSVGALQTDIGFEVAQGVRALGAYKKPSTSKTTQYGSLVPFVATLDVKNTVPLGESLTFENSVEVMVSNKVLFQDLQFTFGGSFHPVFASYTIVGDGGLDWDMNVGYALGRIGWIKTVTFSFGGSYGKKWNHPIPGSVFKSHAVYGLYGKCGLNFGDGFSLKTSYGVPLKKRIGTTQLKNRFLIKFSFQVHF